MKSALAALLAVLAPLCAGAWFSGSVYDGPQCPFDAPDVELSSDALLARPDIQAAISAAASQANAALDTYSLPGLSVAITYKDFPIWSKGFGLANATTKEPVSPQTSVFRIGSQSKIITTLVLFMLREEGVLSFDDAVVKYIPEFASNNAFPRSAPTTLRDLATFQADLPREGCIPVSGSITCGIFLGTNQSLILETTAKAPVVLAPRSGAVYSNFGIALLGAALDVAIRGAGLADSQGQSITDFRSYVTARIANPLGMGSTSFDITPDLAARFAWTASTPTNDATRFLDLGWTAPAGQAVSTASDLTALLRYLMQLHSGAPPAGIPRLLSSSAVREYLRAVTPTEDGLTSFGYAWISVYSDTEHRRVVGKGGAVSGYSSFSALSLDDGVGVVVLGSASFDASSLAVPILHRVSAAVAAARLEAANATYAGVYELSAEQPRSFAAAAAASSSAADPEVSALHALLAASAATESALDFNAPASDASDAWRLAPALAASHWPLRPSPQRQPFLEMPSMAALHWPLRPSPQGHPFLERPILAATAPAAAPLTVTVEADGGRLLAVASAAPTMRLALMPTGAPHQFRLTPETDSCGMARQTLDSMAGVSPSRGLVALDGTDAIQFEVTAPGARAAAIHSLAKGVVFKRVG